MREDIETFVATLAIPADRKVVVLAELLDHVASARERGVEPDLGDLEALRRSLEAIEPAFRTTRCQALVRGLAASVLVAIAISWIGTLAYGVVGALLAVGFAVAFAPPRILDMLRAELRAPMILGKLGRSSPIGPAITYGATILSTPFILWIAVIVIRAFAGDLELDVPWCAFSLITLVFGVLVVEGTRARRDSLAQRATK